MTCTAWTGESEQSHGPAGSPVPQHTCQHASAAQDSRPALPADTMRQAPAQSCQATALDNVSLATSLHLTYMAGLRQMSRDSCSKVEVLLHRFVPAWAGC